MLSGAAVAYVGDYFPYDRRGWANGWVMSGVAAGQIVGIPLGKFLAGAFNFRWPFIVYAIAMAVALLLVIQFVPQPDVKRSKDPLTLRRSIRNYAALLGETKIVAAAAAYTLMFSGIGLYLVFLPTWLESDVLLSNNDIVFLFLVGGIMNVLTGPLAGRISDKVGRKPLIISSCIGLSIVMVTTTLVVNGRWIAYVFFGLAMVMIAMRISPFQALITALVSADRRGILMSLSIAIGQVGMATGSALAGIVYEKFGEHGYFTNTILGAIGMLTMAFVVSRYIPETRWERGLTPKALDAQGDITGELC